MQCLGLQDISLVNNVLVQGKRIEIRDIQNPQITVYNALGGTVLQTNKTSFDLPAQGVYLININGKSIKVLVK